MKVGSWELTKFTTCCRVTKGYGDNWSTIDIKLSPMLIKASEGTLKPLLARAFTLHEHSPCRARSRNSQLFSRRALPRSQVTKGAVRKVIFADIIVPQKTKRFVLEMIFGMAEFYLKKRRKSWFRRTRFRPRGPFH